MSELIIYLLLAHCLMDYPLQGDFMAKAKNKHTAIPGVPWQTMLLTHAFMHSAVVALITQSALCASIELIAHYIIDYAKCNNELTLNQDQFLHILCKFIYIALIAWGVA